MADLTLTDYIRAARSRLEQWRDEHNDWGDAADFTAQARGDAIRRLAAAPNRLLLRDLKDFGADLLDVAAVMATSAAKNDQLLALRKRKHTRSDATKHAIRRARESKSDHRLAAAWARRFDKSLVLGPGRPQQTPADYAHAALYDHLDGIVKRAPAKQSAARARQRDELIRRLLCTFTLSTITTRNGLLRQRGRIAAEPTYRRRFPSLRSI